MNQQSPQILRAKNEGFQRTSSIKLTSRDTVAIDGSVLLGLSPDRSEYMYATKHHVHNRAQQRRSATALDVTLRCGCTNEKISLPSRAVFCMSARWSLILMHLFILIAGVLKLIYLHHFTEPPPKSEMTPTSKQTTTESIPMKSENHMLMSHEMLMIVILGYSSLETAITCVLLILLLAKSKCLFHYAKSSRKRLEYADLPGRSRGRGVKQCIYAYIVITVIMILMCIGLIIFLQLYCKNPMQHMYTVLLNNGAIIISFGINGSLHARLITSMARASLDHHKICLHESVSFLREVQDAVMTIPGLNRGSLMGGGGKEGHKLVHLTTRANLFLNGLASTKDLQCPDYISK